MGPLTLLQAYVLASRCCPCPGGRFQVEPGSYVIVGGEPDWEEPARLFEPLVDHINQRLGRAGAAVRWVPVRDN